MASGSGDSDKELFARMKQEVAMASANPSVQHVVGTLLELADQEFGLTGRGE